jgi:hypothetical protein
MKSNHVSETPERPALGLLYLPAFEPGMGSVAKSRWRRHVLASAAPRERPYMETLFRGYFPGGDIVEISGAGLPQIDLSGANTVVLLFPDAIGLGFAKVEAKLRRDLPTDRLLALNGRGRLMRLDSPTRRRLRVRRFLEWTRLPEFVFLAVFLAVTPLMAGMDLLRGKR